MKNISTISDIGRALYKFRYPAAIATGAGVAGLGIREYARARRDKPVREKILKALKKSARRKDIRDAIKMLEKEEDMDKAKKKILIGKLIMASPTILEAASEVVG